MKSQSKAVVEVVQAIVGVDTTKPAVLTSEQRKQAITMLAEGLMNGEINLSKDYSEAKVRSYASGLLSNWLRKSPALNGGTKYQAKNPGSRSGSQEYKQAVALRATLTQRGEEVPAELVEFIEAHKPQPKSTAKTLDTSALPEHLQSLVG
jgi:hypothetical protein